MGHLAHTSQPRSREQPELIYHPASVDFLRSVVHEGGQLLDFMAPVEILIQLGAHKINLSGFWNLKRNVAAMAALLQDGAGIHPG